MDFILLPRMTLNLLLIFIIMVLFINSVTTITSKHFTNEHVRSKYKIKERKKKVLATFGLIGHLNLLLRGCCG